MPTPVGNQGQWAAGAGVGRFATTHWSVVLAAGRQPSPQSQAALATLCETYWYPLYAYARRRGLSAEDAEDATQGFFAALLEKHYLRSVDRERGRFRSFLLTAFTRFIAKERERALAQRRGGARKVLSLDVELAERRYALEPAEGWTPEKVYERRWALTVLETVMARLRRECSEAGKGHLFESLKSFLTGEPGAPAYRDVANKLGMTQGAIKVAVHRLRRKHRELLRWEVAQTLPDASALDDELGILLAALRGEETR